MASMLDRWKRGVNAFKTSEEQEAADPLAADFGSAGFNTVTEIRPDRIQVAVSNERSIINSIYNKIAVDAAGVQLRHVRLDDQDRYSADIKSPLNSCLTLEANLDQGARHFRQDHFLTALHEGVSALVPIDTDVRLEDGVSLDIYTMRVATVTKWYPSKVKVKVYNERTGKYQEIILPKTKVAIVENPFYSVMNQPNSTLQRLMRKLALLDSVDEAAASGKLDIIMQLPYTVKSEVRRQQANQRRTDLETQLKGSKYGVAYVDATEKITQLNRPAENNMLAQITYLRENLMAELGLTKAVMDGTASEEEMLKYRTGTLEPLLDATVEAMRRTFLTKTARSQNQSIVYFQDPFKLLPMKDIAEIADKFTRNEIMSSNEFRGKIGMRPSSDPKADQLVNSNMPTGDTGVAVDPAAPADPNAAPDDSAEAGDDDPENIMNSAFDSMDSMLDDVFSSLGVDENSIDVGGAADESA